MLKILQVRLQQYRNQEITDVQAGFRKGRGTRDQTANIHWIIEKSREFQINIYFCFIVEKEMATHSSILAWRIPGTEEPGGLQCTGSQRVRHNWAAFTSSPSALLTTPKPLIVPSQKTVAPWKKSYDKLRQYIKKQRHYFLTKVHLVKAMVFPVVVHGRWELDHKESWALKNRRF